MIASSPRSPSAGGRFGRRLLGAAILSALMAAVTAAGCNNAGADKKDSKRTEVVVAATITDPDVFDFQDFTGRLDAYKTVEVRARVSGYITDAPFKEGDIVQAGQALFQIDIDPYKVDLDLAEANLRVARADQNLQEKNAARARKLIENRGISPEDFDTAIAALVKAEATVGSIQASLTKAQLYMGYTRVTAPLTGRISRRYVDPGNLVNADSTLLTTIVSITPVYAYFDVDERAYLDLQKRPTRRVLMRLANEDQFTHTGAVDFIDNRVNANAGTIRMRGVFDYIQGLTVVTAATGAAAPAAPPLVDKLPSILSPGLFARVRVPVGEPYKAVLVPDEALMTDQGRKNVLVVKEVKIKDQEAKEGEEVKDKRQKGEGAVEYRQVETGQLIDGMRVIKKGLTGEPGEYVVVSGQQRVRLNTKERQEVDVTINPTPKLPESPLGALFKN
jgi:multidrug efflux system membrane fusion protein